MESSAREFASTSSHQRERESRRGSRHGEILAAALELFAEQGYLATTMEQIGESVGLRGASLYRHVGSKQEILYEIISGSMSRLLEQQSDALYPDRSTIERFRRAVEAQVRFHARFANEAFVGTRETRNLEGVRFEMVVDMQRRYVGRLRALLEQGLEEGVFSMPSSRLAAYSLLDMGIGVASWFKPGGPYSEEELVSIYSEYACRLVGADQGSNGELGSDGRPIYEEMS